MTGTVVKSGCSGTVLVPLVISLIVVTFVVGHMFLSNSWPHLDVGVLLVLSWM